MVFFFCSVTGRCGILAVGHDDRTVLSQACKGVGFLLLVAAVSTEKARILKNPYKSRVYRDNYGACNVSCN